MKCGKLTAKLRDAVPICFIEEGKEVKRLKNIEIPDTIKDLEYKGFKFDVPLSGAITFKIYFEPGTLPETWPEPRHRNTRKAEAADPEAVPQQPAQETVVVALTAAMEQAREEDQPVNEIAEAAAQGAEITTEIIEGENGSHEIIISAEDDPEPETMTIQYDVPGSARKALANTIGEAIGAYPEYQAAPSFAYIIGEYTLDRSGVLSGPQNDQLVRYLAGDGYKTK